VIRLSGNLGEVNNPRVLALFSVVCWTFSAYLSRSISIRSQCALLILSFSTAFVVLLAYFALRRPDPGANRFTRVKPAYLLLGPLGYFVYAVALFRSYRAFNSASETTVLNYTWPLFTVLFTEVLFRHVFRRRQPAIQGGVEALGIALGFLSVLALATEGRLTVLDFSNLPGLGWGLLAGASYGLFSAYSSTVSGKEQGTFLLVAVFTSIVLVCLTATVTSEIGLLGALAPQDVIYPVVWGCVGNGIGYIVWTRANRLAREQGVGVSAIASAMFVLPLLGLTVVAVLLNERQLLQGYFVLSLVLILLGSLLCQKADSIASWAGRRLALAPGETE
jgi:drug/metabolite transporter (DMT)-like permease